MQIITVGGFKGGTGKTTLAALISVAAKLEGVRVAGFDLDRNTRNFSSFLLRRQAEKLASPDHVMLMEPADGAPNQPLRIEPLARMARRDGYELLVIDTGSGSFDGVYEAHLLADVIVTPMNDSPADLYGLFAPNSPRQPPRINYRDMIDTARFERRRQRFAQQKWYVCRNRVAALPSRIGTDVARRVGDLAVEAGLDGVLAVKDRVSHRAIAAEGRTILDPVAGARLTMSEVAGRCEIRALLSALVAPAIAAAA